MKKISLIGAGNIGTILAYSISRKNIGNIVLVDIVEGLAEGKCLDLGQSFPVDNINLKVTENAFIGIQGKSGSGKTTLVNLILGLLKPTKGKILLNEKLRNLDNPDYLTISWRKVDHKEPWVLNILLPNNAQECV